MKTETASLPESVPMTWHPRFTKRGEVGCPLCGKDLKPNDKRRFIHVTDGGGSIARADIPEDQVDSMGWFDIGSSCAKKLGLAYSKELPAIVSANHE